ncbi:alkaline shock response membrane anchor protein AmaP [Alkalihalobacillus sp. LMS6]|uniref:alkaline shock response membrane anchor protein AmaP n=1 Tax=Alkalihalobacillus sp. LMS6 TaxID=2924034 RepID=UPI0020D16D7E|nr:alkaline shock response membrane anchor protein AmaP [Alkalihalobacillus sp. LMS6]UTR05945.1 alkaline shock response membrane anchor protein AmaP [Alkalihalobacillus sp. LMS6]
MNGVLRFFMALFALLTLVISVGFILQITNVYNVFDEILALGEPYFWVLIGVFAFLILLSLILFFASFRRSESEIHSYHVSTEVGEIGISKQSIESTALKSARSLDGMRSLEIHSRISRDSNQVALEITYTPFGPNPVQQNAKKLQDRVKQDLESWLEVAVSEVKVFVKQNQPNQNKRQRVI